MIGIFSNGFRTSKSGSPVTRQSDFPERASSKYLLSSGSRQRVTWWETSIILLWLVNRRIKKSLSYSFLKYLSNFFFFRVVENSSVVDVERITTSFKNAFLAARNETELAMIAALTRTFASMTTVIRYFSFRRSFRISSVIPCFLAYSPMSPITSNNDLLSFNSRDKVSRANCFSFSVSLSNFNANSSLTIIVFINSGSIAKYNEMKIKLV